MRQNRCIRVIFWFPKQHDRSCLDWVHLSSVPYLHPSQWSLKSSRTWYWWTYLQGRDRDADIKNGLVNTAGEGEGGKNWEISIDIYILPYIKWAFLVAHLVKNLPAMWETWFDPWDGKIPWRWEQLPTPVFWPREFQALYSLWGCKETDMTERLSLSCVKLIASGKLSILHMVVYTTQCYFLS